jgi:3-oxoadipate enol-lactonase
MTSLDANGIALHRAGTGAPLVLLHCLGVDHRFWNFASPLESRFTLLRYDLPGHGATRVPERPYSIEDLAEQLAALLQANRIRRASIAGISLGGLVAQSFAARHSERVDSLVLIDTTPRYTDEMRAMWVERAAIARSQGVAALVPGLLPIWFSQAALEQNLPGVQYVRATLASTSGEGYALACDALAAADLRAEAQRIRARTLVVCGDEDIPSFLEAARWLSTAIRGAKLAWIAAARHASVLEKPKEAIAVFTDFLA